MDTVTAQLVFGIIVIVIAIGLIYWINRRKFYRRSAAGVEMFSRYSTAIFVRFLERVGKWIAYALIVLGVVCIWTYSQMKKDKEKQEVKTEKPTQR
jgi:membrane protein DedA with SNARE-associated domain